MKLSIVALLLALAGSAHASAHASKPASVRTFSREPFAKVRLAEAAAPAEPAADTLADTVDRAEDISAWDGRPRLQFGAARIILKEEEGSVYPIFLSINYRLSWNPSPGERRSLRLGLGAEAGIFYLYPYLLIGPELSY